MVEMKYVKTYWENDPSTNTPFYANGFANMDTGISNCADRLNGNIPYDNIIDNDEATATTEREKYAYDAVDMRDISERIGNNIIYYEGRCGCSIKNDNATSKLPIGNYSLVKIKDISPQISNKSVVDASVEFDATGIDGYENANLFAFVTSISGYSQYSGSYTTISSYGSSISYNRETGTGKVNGLVKFANYNNSYIKLNVALYAYV